VTHHLVILKPQYLHLVLEGTKTLECRLSQTRRLPFGAVRSGDTLWLKRSAGPIVAKARARRIESIELGDAITLKMIASRYRDDLRIGPAFFRDRRGARYLTLIRFDRVRRIPALRIEKRDRHAWVILPGPPEAQS
jgi:hypothetical protein